MQLGQQYIFDKTLSRIRVTLNFLTGADISTNTKMYSNGEKRQPKISCVTCHVLHVTCHISATDPLPANSKSTVSMLVHKDPKTQENSKHKNIKTTKKLKL